MVCSYLTTAKARVQSVPHWQRSKPQASNTRASGSQMSGYGYGSFDSVPPSEPGSEESGLREDRASLPYAYLTPDEPRSSATRSRGFWMATAPAPDTG